MRGVLWCGEWCSCQLSLRGGSWPGRGAPVVLPVWELGGELVNLEHRASLRDSVVPHPSVPGDVNLERAVALSPKSTF